MKVVQVALICGAAVLIACGGSEKPKDTARAAAQPSGAAGPTGSPSAPAAAPITGKTVEVKMIGDAQGYRFDPNQISIKPGDAVKFTVVNGGPHNVAFDPATVPADSKDQLDANMENRMSELSSPMLMNPDESYTISFGNVKPGTYPFHCTPHLAMGMTGTITVR